MSKNATHGLTLVRERLQVVLDVVEQASDIHDLLSYTLASINALDETLLSLENKVSYDGLTAQVAQPFLAALPVIEAANDLRQPYSGAELYEAFRPARDAGEAILEDFARAGKAALRASRDWFSVEIELTRRGLEELSEKVQKAQSLPEGTPDEYREALAAVGSEIESTFGAFAEVEKDAAEAIPKMLEFAIQTSQDSLRADIGSFDLEGLSKVEGKYARVADIVRRVPSLATYGLDMLLTSQGLPPISTPILIAARWVDERLVTPKMKERNARAQKEFVNTSAMIAALVVIPNGAIAAARIDALGTQLTKHMFSRMEGDGGR
jgi:hypothetical protein